MSKGEHVQEIFVDFWSKFPRHWHILQGLQEIGTAGKIRGWSLTSANVSCGHGVIRPYFGQSLLARLELSRSINFGQMRNQSRLSPPTPTLWSPGSEIVRLQGGKDGISKKFPWICPREALPWTLAIGCSSTRSNAKTRIKMNGHIKFDVQFCLMLLSLLHKK